MSICQAPHTVLKLLKVVRAQVFWSKNAGDREIQWIVWTEIMASIDTGGVGAGSLYVFHKVLILSVFGIF